LNFALRATDGDFLELVRRYLGDFLVDRGGTDEGLFSADCGIERRMPGGKPVRNKLTLYVGTMPIHGGLVKEEMAARLISYVRDRATRESNEFVRIRATAFTVDARAVMLPSPPEPHLPALAGMLLRSGCPYLGDELVNFDPILWRVRGSPFPLFLDAEDLPLFPKLEREPPRRSRREPTERTEFQRAMTPRRPVAPEELGGQRSQPAPVGWIVFPYFEAGAETRLEPAGGSEAIFRFTEAVLNLHIWEDRALTLIRDLVEAVPVSRLVVGSIPEAAELLARSAPSLVQELTR
jgi:hypothetical protein